MSLFITFEGPEGSGKSTQARRLYERIEGAGFSVIHTREPGGTRIGDMIRGILLDLAHLEMAATTETLLFSASRAQLVDECIQPFLEQGGIVICDRFVDSTFAYQGYGLGRDLDELRAITRIATGDLLPHITIYLDLPVRKGLDRKRTVPARSTVASPPGAAGRQSDMAEWNRLDAREIEFHERVREGYRALIAAEPERWLVFDGHLDRNVLADMIWEKIEPRIARLSSPGDQS